MKQRLNGGFIPKIDNIRNKDSQYPSQLPCIAESHSTNYLSNWGCVVHTVTPARYVLKKTIQLVNIQTLFLYHGKNMAILLLKDVSNGLSKYQARLHYLMDQTELIVRIDVVYLVLME